LVKLSHFLSLAEGAAIAFCLFAAILIALWQFADRNLHNAHLPTVEAPAWTHGLLRHSIFLLGFLGGAFATFQAKHIRIDALTRMIKGKGKLALRIATTLAALVVVYILIKASWKFHLDNAAAEAGDASQSEEVFNSSRGALIMFCGYILVAFHFAVQTVIDAGWLLAKGPIPKEWLAEDHGEGAGLIDDDEPPAAEPVAEAAAPAAEPPAEKTAEGGQ
jgi:TRAP-type C4-dicarboxylate transport system permease small subunit